MPAFLYDLTILWHYMDLLLCAWENVLKKQLFLSLVYFEWTLRSFSLSFPLSDGLPMVVCSMMCWICQIILHLSPSSASLWCFRLAFVQTPRLTIQTPSLSSISFYSSFTSSFDVVTCPCTLLVHMLTCWDGLRFHPHILKLNWNE